ncbi:hypothetical protein [Actinosynnema sp. NPDC020468]|uniref:hypothetical protein n=1 Tax=Actinosynnema sp. NPDC020468 TaxID=3154488 RepID=UPI0033E1D180
MHVTEELPPYRALLVVDVKDFSGRPGRDHAGITESIPVLLAGAFGRCGLGDAWREQRFGVTTGDGYAVGFPSAVLPFLLNPLLGALQEELAQRSVLRLRASVNVGPMTDTGVPTISSGSGAARVETHRLLDSDPVKALLARSGEATRVAAVVSARAYEDAVLTGYAADPPEHYVEVPVAVKAYRGTAYLRVPTPTGDLLASGFAPTTAPTPDRVRSGRPGSVRNVAHDVRGPVVQAGTIEGGVHQYAHRRP